MSSASSTYVALLGFGIKAKLGLGGGDTSFDIARILFELGHVRELNEGVPRIYHAMDALSLAQPEYTDHASTVKLTLRNKVTEHDETIISNVIHTLESIWSELNDTQRHIIQHLLHNQQSTVAELSEASEVAS